MSFQSIADNIYNLLRELEGYDCSCDLRDVIDTTFEYVGILRDETYTCHGCGRILSEERVTIAEYDDEIYCNCCYEKHKPKNPIRTYHETKGTLKFKELNELLPVYYRGLEIEVETDINESVLEVLRNTNSTLFRFEEDSSLKEGFEIITAPMSRLYWNRLGFYEVETLINELQKVSNPIAWDSGCCGLHIHFNRVEISNQAQKFLTKFMIENHEFITKISGRDDFEYCRNPVTHDYELDNNNQIYNYDRYLTLNFTPDTLEFRFWRGTLKTEHIKASVQLTEDLISFAETAVKYDEYKPTENDFLKFITVNHPELHKFIEKRRARWSKHYGEY